MVLLQGSYLSDVRLSSSVSRVRVGEPLRLDLSFRVDGEIRNSLNQERWTEAYDKHDNTFLIKYLIRIQTGSVKKRDIVEPLRFVRKASFYWSRNPKLPPPPPNKKIWAMLVIDDRPNLPDTEDDAKSLLLDVNRSIELIGSNLGQGTHKIFAEVSASWGKHIYTESGEVKGKSNQIEITCV